MSVGVVYLVGAGPGDPGLLTLRGRECLQRADLVLYDGLVNPVLLRETRAESERTCRVGEAGERRLDQAEINRRLIAAALAGQTVVRLKGGDPFVFGRGAEEAAALAAAGIPFEVVPGVSAAIAASAYAGISLTHRGLASGVAFVTGHEDPTKESSALDYEQLARFPGTLVFYMGLHRLPAIAAALLQAGKPPATPSCVICRGTWPAQQTVAAPLAQLPDAVRQAELHAPSLIVVGECVALRDEISWFERRPLFGLRIGITRPSRQAGPQIARAYELGAEPVLLPTIEIRPPEDWDLVDAALDRLAQYEWIVFTSANGVQGLLSRLFERGGDLRRLGQARLAAIGSETARALREFHLAADLVPPEFRAEALAAELAPHVAGRRVLWARASRGRDVLPGELRAAGASLDEVVVYQNLDVPAWPADLAADVQAGRLDWLALSSPSIARNVARLWPEAARAQPGMRPRLASISPVTTAAAQSVGLPIAAEATTFTWEGLFQAIAAARQ